MTVHDDGSAAARQGAATKQRTWEPRRFGGSQTRTEACSSGLDRDDQMVKDCQKLGRTIQRAKDEGSEGTRKTIRHDSVRPSDWFGAKEQKKKGWREHKAQAMGVIQAAFGRSSHPSSLEREQGDKATTQQRNKGKRS